MDYSVKQETDAITGPLSRRMPQTDRAEDRDRVAESKFYLPAGVTPSIEASPFDRIRATLFTRRV
jgi:hypothetical protein